MSEQEELRDDAPAQPGDDRWEMEPNQPDPPGALESQPSTEQDDEGPEPV